MKVRSALAVKYRPRFLEDLVGQDVLVQQVKGFFHNAVGIPGSFLITGPTGCGKTTVARILAQCINCENFNLEKMQPCKLCKVCLANAEHDYPGVVEINFSDARGIDTVRDVINQTRYAPHTNSHVFILDEMHNMTKDGQNALLKTLEEPPSNCVFILLTTDPQKVLETIKNRCVMLSVRRVDDYDLAKCLYKIAARENFHVFDSESGMAIYKILALLSKGIVRQGITLLESIIAAVEGGKNPEDLLKKEYLVDFLALENDEIAVEQSFSKFFMDAVYRKKYGPALLNGLALFRPVERALLGVFCDKLIDYHVQTLYVMVDPEGKENLTPVFYNSWKATLIKFTHERAIFINIKSANEILDILIDLRSKLSSLDFNSTHVLTNTIIRMVGAVEQYEKFSDNSYFYRYCDNLMDK